MVLVLLPPGVGRDIASQAFGVSGGENGFPNSCCIGGDRGVLGNGFSRLLCLLIFLSCRGARGPENCSGAAGIEIAPGAVGGERSVVWISEGLRPRETEPKFLIPLRTPVKKSPFSGGGFEDEEEERSSGFESDEVVMDSSEPAGRRVSLSDMINHAAMKPKRIEVEDEGRTIIKYRKALRSAEGLSI